MATPDLKQLMDIEWERCSKDPVYFITKYCVIQHPMKGKLKFALYPFQKDVIEACTNNLRVAILKSRQMGISTVMGALEAWYIIFHPDHITLVIAMKQKVATAIIDKVKLLIVNLPQWMKDKMPKIREWNQLSVGLENDSKITAVSSASDSGRSVAATRLIVDEMAFLRNDEEMWASVQPILSTGGSACLLSTPNGQANLFYKVCQEAEENKNGFKFLKLPWYLHPERDQAWRDQQDKELGKRKASQECDTNFLTSGATLILPDRLAELKKRCSEPIAKVGFDQGMWIWKYPMPGHNYLVAADVARGDGADSNATQIFDLESLEQVAEYQGKLDTNTYADLLVEWAKNYNNALLAIENTGIGWSVVSRVIEDGYPNIYKSTKGGDKVTATKYLTNGYDTDDSTVEGFTNSGKSRPLLINKLDTYLNNPDLEIKINSVRLINELYVFQWINRKAQAQKGYHDDLVMSYCIGLYIRDTALQLQEYSKNIIQSTLQSFKTGTTACKVYSSTNFKNPWSIQSPNGRENIDLTQFLDKR